MQQNRKTCWEVGCKRPQIKVSCTIAITLISFGKEVRVQKKNQFSKETSYSL